MYNLTKNLISNLSRVTESVNDDPYADEIILPRTPRVADDYYLVQIEGTMNVIDPTYDKLLPIPKTTGGDIEIVVKRLNELLHVVDLPIKLRYDEKDKFDISLFYKGKYLGYYPSSGYTISRLKLEVEKSIDELDDIDTNLYNILTTTSVNSLMYNLPKYRSSLSKYILTPEQFNKKVQELKSKPTQLITDETNNSNSIVSGNIDPTKPLLDQIDRKDLVETSNNYTNLTIKKVIKLVKTKISNLTYNNKPLLVEYDKNYPNLFKVGCMLYNERYDEYEFTKLYRLVLVPNESVYRYRLVEVTSDMTDQQVSRKYDRQMSLLFESLGLRLESLKDDDSPNEVSTDDDSDMIDEYTDYTVDDFNNDLKLLRSKAKRKRGVSDDD